MARVLSDRQNALRAGLALVVLITLLWVTTAPPERTLGAGIRSVYLHVGLTWAGMTFLGLASFLGLLFLFKPRAGELFWLRSLGWIGWGLFAAGLLTSLLAAQLNWGGVFLQEPRTMAALRVLILGLIVQILMGWPISRRIKGLLWVALGGVLAGGVIATPLVLHPQDAVRTSTSAAIQISFVGITALFLLAGVLILGLLRARRPE